LETFESPLAKPGKYRKFTKLLLRVYVCECINGIYSSSRLPILSSKCGHIRTMQKPIDFLAHMFASIPYFVSKEQKEHKALYFPLETWCYKYNIPSLCRVRPTHKPFSS